MLPRPTSTTTGPGELVLDESTQIVTPADLAPTADWLQAALKPATGLRLPVRLASADEAVPTPAGAVVLARRAELGAEAYRLVVAPGGARIEGGDAAGVFYGAQALCQLLPAEVYRRAPVTGVRWAVPAVTVEDRPRFGWRGAMLDVARHFMPKHDVLRFVDLLAMHRLNTLHLHLTDDQGWRLEVRAYPRLTEVGSWRHETQVGAVDGSPTDGRPHGGFYTQDDVREIVTYAAARHVSVVPEIDVPGHSQAAIAAYPELGITGEQLDVFASWGINPNVLNTEDTTVDFYRTVLDEVMELFPGPFIGIGGDECPKDQWRSDPRTQALMVARGLADEEALQAWFIRQLGTSIAARGRRLFGWDEILESDVPPGATVASWRGMTGAVTAARKGFDVVSCPDDQVYLDYRQSESPDEPIPVAIALTLADVYAFEPIPPELGPDEAARILGGQANIWTEHMDSPRTVDFFVFPRLCAVAEALWTTGERDFGDFTSRLGEHLARLDAIGVEYRPESGPLPWQRRPGVVGRPTTRAEWASYVSELVANIRE